MADASTTLPAPPKSRAAFSRDDVPDAKRGYPDFDLREFASRRGLEWLDHTTPAGYRAAVPGKEELQSNTLRGELAGGAYGVLAHEGLEVGYSGDSFDWGGTFYSIRVRTTGVGLRGMLPFSGRANEALVRIPCTVAGVRLSESVGSQLCLRIDTRRSAPPVSFGHRIKLDELIGIDGWSVWGLPKVEPDALASLVREPVAELIRAHAEDGLFQVIVWWGTLLVRRNGFLRDDEPLDELGRAASILAARVREICLQRAEPRPFASELAPPLFRDWQDPQVIFNPSDTWHAWAEDTARRYGFARAARLGDVVSPASTHRRVTMAIETETIGTAEPPLAAAQRVAPHARALAERIEQERALPRELVDELLDAGLLSLCLPRALGGREAHPAQMVRALEELARADGATAWCAMVASTSSLLGAYLPPQEAELIYAGGRSVTGGVFAPRGRAERRGGAYVVDGRWSFVSGVTHCDWVLGGCVVHDDGEPVLLEDGSPDVRLMLMPIDGVEVIDTWSVSGLRGTGSHDMTAVAQLVPAARGVSLFTDRPRHPGALYSFPLFGLLAVGIAAVALGIARGAVEDLVSLAGAKTPASGRRALAERATVQALLARAEAALRAARGLVLGEVEAAWLAAERGGAMPEERRLGLRLAASHATEVAAEVVTSMYHAGGGTSIYDSSPLQRRFRDVHVATQHMMVAPATWELAGRLLLGLPTDARQL